MILSAQSIRRRVRRGRNPDFSNGMIIEPFFERSTAHGMSYGLSACGYDLRIKDAVVLMPGAFVLAVSVEYFSIPKDIMAQLADKSSWARRGVAIQNTIFEPGWRGYPTLELSNHGPEVISIPAAAPIGQLIFHVLDEPTQSPYDGKYQDQPQRPVAAIEENA